METPGMVEVEYLDRVIQVELYLTLIQTNLEILFQ
jgi:hypothetical protein